MSSGRAASSASRPSRSGDIAGTAAAVLGAVQFMIGGSIAPLVGTLDDGTPLPLAAIIVCTTGLAAGLFWSVRRRTLDRDNG